MKGPTVFNGIIIIIIIYTYIHFAGETPKQPVLFTTTTTIENKMTTHDGDSMNTEISSQHLSTPKVDESKSLPGKENDHDDYHDMTLENLTFSSICIGSNFGSYYPLILWLLYFAKVGTKVNPISGSKTSCQCR